MQQESLTKSAPTWSISSPAAAPLIQALMDDVPGLHHIVATILCKRGHRDHKTVKRFMTPGIESLDHLPEMKDLQKAAKRVLKAIELNEKILVYGDYDVDGSCATAMMFHFLKSLGAEVAYYNPDRYKEGYGISKAGIAYAAANDYSLIVALDCGIAAVDRITEALGLGIAFIVCDHHLPGEVLPPAFAILNPKQEGCSFNGEELCGCGVGFILVKQLCESLKLPDEHWKQYLPLVAVATCCDIVDLTGLNRSLVAEGLKIINSQPPAGVAALLHVAAYQGHVDVSDVVFKLGPRINAAGRLAHAREAVELLIQADLPAAMPFAERLEKLNRERRSLDKEITAEAIEIMRNKDPELGLCSTVVKNADWHKGVIGIVASRLTEVCYRPTVVFAEVEGMLTGSARSVDGFDLYAAIKACSHLLTNFGGHRSAAGLGLKAENYEAFCTCFEDAVKHSIGVQDRNPKLHIDVEADFNAWHDGRFNSFFNQLNRMKPFGPKNREPVFATRLCKAKHVRTVGEEHLKFKVYQEGENGTSAQFDVIAFGFGHLYTDLQAGAGFDLAYTMGINHWNGSVSFQLEAKDLRVSAET